LYESFYELSRKPFDNVPDTDFYFETAITRDAFDSLRFSTQEEGAVSVLSGRNGCGKTLLLRMLMKELAPRCEIACLAGALDSPEGFLSELIYQLGGDGAAAGGRPELSRKAGEMLFHALDSGKRSLLVFDHTSGILREEVAQELAKLANLQLDDRSLSSILISDEGTLEAGLASSSLGPRVTVIARLGPLSLLESIFYMNHRLKVAGGMPEVLTGEAKSAIAAAAGGVPARINALADLSLYLGAREGARPVDVRIVDTAIRKSSRNEIQGPSQEI
jgi:type II secretory pathway predicted ATPase ExeA